MTTQQRSLYIVPAHYQKKMWFTHPFWASSVSCHQQQDWVCFEGETVGLMLTASYDKCSSFKKKVGNRKLECLINRESSIVFVSFYKGKEHPKIFLWIVILLFPLLACGNLLSSKKHFLCKFYGKLPPDVSVAINFVKTLLLLLFSLE